MKPPLIGVAALLLAPLAALLSAAAPRPNVIVLLTDDQGYGDLARHGKRPRSRPHQVVLPNLERCAGVACPAAGKSELVQLTTSSKPTRWNQFEIPPVDSGRVEV